MAEAKVVNVQLDTLERVWVKQSLTNQRNVLVRQIAKEIVGSDIYELRKRDLQFVEALARKFN